ncbi:PAAR domain-containing protein [Proteus alimentorum]|nr:PAAR domain-containing protein [Proteus alimentorum]
MTGGSDSLFVDGKPAARVGDNINCGGILIGATLVNIG